MRKTLKIKCDPEGNLKRMPWKKLKSMQGDFKTLDDEGRRTLRNSLEKVGFIAPFFVWYGKDFLLDGVQRTDVLDDMKNEGWKIPDELPVVSIEAKTKKEAIANIARFSSSHGIVTTQGAINLFGIEGLKIIAPTIRIPQLDIQEILLMDSQQDETTDVADLIDRAAELNKKWKVKTGDLWVLGNHRLLCGDATKKEDVERLMDGKKADMVFTDPPYGMSYQSNAWDSKIKHVKEKRTDRKITNDDTTDTGKQFIRLIPEVVRDNTHFYVWCRWDCFNEFSEACCQIGKIKSVIVWDKCHPGLGDLKGSYGDNEWLIFGMIGRRELKERQNGVWQATRLKGLQMKHPTQKPIELFVRGVLNSTNIREIILDSFLGSGSTLIACEETNRKCYGMEIEPNYCATVLERWHQYTGLLPEKIEEA